MNAIDLEVAAELITALEQVRGDESVAALVLAAEGPTFSAGVDVRDHLPDRGAEMLRRFHRVCGLLLAIDAPVIATVQGAALGGGSELTLACDLVVAAASARFGFPEIKLGVFPPLAAVALPRAISPHLASELLLTGRSLDAEEARRAGWVNRVAPEGGLGAAVDGLLAELGALSPASLRFVKRALRLSRARPTAEEIEAAERLYVEELMHSDDAVEGLKAFLEKRAPVWRGGAT